LAGEGAALRVPFRDRVAAGQALGERVAGRAGLHRPVVVALVRGGVPVGAEVARQLGAPLLAMPVAKVGAPGQEELAVGAVAPGGVSVLNEDVVVSLGLGAAEIDALVGRAAAKVATERRSYRGGDQFSLAGRATVVVDDGLATGATMRAALASLRERAPSLLLMAVPVAPPEALEALAPLADDCVCLVKPRHMRAVGAWYEDFTQISDEQVLEALAELGPRARVLGPGGQNHALA
jgi:putative phosphoribosyl transferase